MRKFVLAVAAIAALAATPARSQTTFPTPNPALNVSGVVDMCPTGAGSYVACDAAGALPRGVVLKAPIVIQQNPAALTAIASGTTSAVTATMATTINGDTAFLCGFDVSAIGGTAAIGPITVTGLLGGTFTYQLVSTATGVTLGRTFSPCVPASKAGQSIAVVTTADGSASAVNVQAYGIQQ